MSPVVINNCFSKHFIGRGRPRPQVDEFGNPLGDIHSVDTTRFELGESTDAEELR